MWVIQKSMIMNNLQELICSFVFLSIETLNNIGESEYGDSESIQGLV